MLFSQIRRLFTWLTHSHANSTSDAPAADTPSIFEIDPMWHGDHWQNLLASPMDARHYVMEDWSVPAVDEWDEVDGAAPAH
jgi:hypothetical protein